MVRFSKALSTENKDNYKNNLNKKNVPIPNTVQKKYFKNQLI